MAATKIEPTRWRTRSPVHEKNPEVLYLAEQGWTADIATTSGSEGAFREGANTDLVNLLKGRKWDSVSLTHTFEGTEKKTTLTLNTAGTQIVHADPTFTS